jgi:hypothetical protein
MRFILWGNAYNIEHLEKGYKLIKVWWTLSVISVLSNRLVSILYTQAKYGEDFQLPTYMSMTISLLILFCLFLSAKLVINIDKAEATRLLS